jgi:tetratricopeptide (TPR) repeat protein
MFTDEEVRSLVEDALRLAYEMFREGKHKHCCVVVEQLLKVSPDLHEALQLYGVTLHALGRNEESVKALEACLVQKPDDPETLNNIAISYSSLGLYHEAISSLRRAVDIKPESELYLSNLALQHRHLEDYRKAIEIFEQSNAICEKATTLAMIGGCYGELRELDRAMEYTSRAIRCNPEFAEAHVDMASILHLKGNWRDGFREYEWRTKVYDQLKFWDKIYRPDKLWDGSPIDGKTLIVHTEQGNGDTIQFCRFLPLLAQRCSRVIVHCSEVMAPILAGLCHEVYTRDPAAMPSWQERDAGVVSDLPEHDLHCFMISLPHLLGVGSISGRPYLSPTVPFDLGEYSGFLKVGIAWGGNPQHPNDRKRSCRLGKFKPIHDLGGVRLFSLMKDVRPRSYHNSKDIIDLTHGCDDMKIVDMSPHMTSYEATAGIIESLDLVLSVDTSVVHLAGAIGKDTLCLMAWNPDWRWGLSGDRTIWYDSVKLLRQDRPGDWSGPFTEALEQIKKRRDQVGHDA